jgi:hypothetical protein
MFAYSCAPQKAKTANPLISTAISVESQELPTSCEGTEVTSTVYAHPSPGCEGGDYSLQLRTLTCTMQTPFHLQNRCHISSRVGADGWGSGQKQGVSSQRPPEETESSEQDLGGMTGDQAEAEEAPSKILSWQQPLDPQPA